MVPANFWTATINFDIFSVVDYLQLQQIYGWIQQSSRYHLAVTKNNNIVTRGRKEQNAHYDLEVVHMENFIWLDFSENEDCEFAKTHSKALKSANLL